MSKIKNVIEIIKDANEQINSVLRVTSGEPGLGKVTFVVAKTAILAIVGTILLMIIPFSLLITVSRRSRQSYELSSKVPPDLRAKGSSLIYEALFFFHFT